MREAIRKQNSKLKHHPKSASFFGLVFKGSSASSSEEWPLLFRFQSLLLRFGADIAVAYLLKGLLWILTAGSLHWSQRQEWTSRLLQSVQMSLNQDKQTWDSRHSFCEGFIPCQRPSCVLLLSLHLVSISLDWTQELMSGGYKRKALPDVLSSQVMWFLMRVRWNGGGSTWPWNIFSSVTVWIVALEWEKAMRATVSSSNIFFNLFFYCKQNFPTSLFCFCFLVTCSTRQNVIINCNFLCKIKWKSRDYFFFASHPRERTTNIHSTWLKYLNLDSLAPPTTTIILHTLLTLLA